MESSTVEGVEIILSQSQSKANWKGEANGILECLLQAEVLVKVVIGKFGSTRLFTNQKRKRQH